MKNVLRVAMFLCATYVVGGALALILLFLRLIGRVKVVNAHNLLPRRRGNVVVSNHPSFYIEGLIIPLSYFPHIFWHPFKYSPWFTPDEQNFSRPWYFRWLSCLKSIPIHRGEDSTEKNKASVAKILHKLQAGESVILFGEGGRTTKVLNGVDMVTGERLLSPMRKKMLRRFRYGLRKFIERSDCDTIPVWAEGPEKVLPCGKIFPRFWKSKVIIHVGAPIPGPISLEELEQTILRLADKTAEHI